MRIPITTITIIAIMALLLPGCENDRDLGPVSTRDYDVTEFQHVEIKGLGTVVLHDGPDHEVSIATHLEVHEHTEVRITGDRLIIDLTKNFNGNNIDRLEIDITAPSYTGITLSGVGDITSSDGIEAEQFEAVLTGVGNITARAIDADEVVTTLDGVGDITLEGICNHHDVLLKDVGAVKSYDLASVTCTARLTGVGDIRINVADALTATLSGVGDIIYMGDPTVDSNITGEGSVRKK